MAIRFKAWVAPAACCLLVLASPVKADEDTTNSYVSINVGQSKEKNACTSPNVPAGTACSESYNAYRFAYGYQFTPAWGMELSYGDLGYAEAKLTAPTLHTWSLKATGWTISGTGTLNLGQRFSLFGKVGGVRANFNEDMMISQGINAGYTHATYGGGVQFNITPTFSIRAQYENFGSYALYNSYGAKTPAIKLTMASAGFLFRF